MAKVFLDRAIIERGERRLTIDVAEKVAQALGMPLSKLGAAGSAECTGMQGIGVGEEIASDVVAEKVALALGVPLSKLVVKVERARSIAAGPGRFSPGR